MRRPRGTARHLAPALVTLAVLSTAIAAPAAHAEPGADTPVAPVPSRAEVDLAADQADVAAMDLATVRSRLAALEQQAAAAAERAAQAAEAYNGARWRADRAAQAAGRQEVRAAAAAAAAPSCARPTPTPW